MAELGRMAGRRRMRTDGYKKPADLPIVRRPPGKINRRKQNLPVFCTTSLCAMGAAPIVGAALISSGRD